MWFGNHTTPINNIILYCALYWTCSGLYSIFIYGYDSSQHSNSNGLGLGLDYLPLNYMEHFSIGKSFQFGILRDEYVSIWNNTYNNSTHKYHTQSSIYKSILNLILLFLPWVAILYNYYGKSTQTNNTNNINSNTNWFIKYLIQLSKTNEHFIFLISIMNLLSIFCSQLWSIRLLGLISFICGILSNSNNNSNIIESAKFSNRVI